MRRSSRVFGSFWALRFTPQKSEILMMLLRGTPACRLVSLSRRTCGSGGWWITHIKQNSVAFRTEAINSFETIGQTNTSYMLRLSHHTWFVYSVISDKSPIIQITSYFSYFIPVSSNISQHPFSNTLILYISLNVTEQDNGQSYKGIYTCI